MKTVDIEIFSSCLGLPDLMVVTALFPTENALYVHLSYQTKCAVCPFCQAPSERVHGRYSRTVADVPCGGRRVVLCLTVRKFVCATTSCLHQMFTERHPDFLQSYARMTNRLRAALQAVGLAAGGEMGTRLADAIGVTTTPSTVLRHIMKLPNNDHPHVRVLGVDDFAWKKGRRYGTILVDLEKRKIIDLLPDRKAASFAQWLRKHPEVEIVSRDRGTDYAAGAREGVPQALQIADRFHLVRNLADALQLLLARCRAEIRRAEEEAHPKPEPKNADSPPRSLPTPATWRQEPPRQMVRTYEAHKAQREDRFQQVVSLREQGMKQADIAKRVGISERTVRQWLKQGALPSHRRPNRHSIFDPYAAYVLSRWQEGMHDGQQLFEEIRAQGFKGTARLVRRFLQTLRDKRNPLTDLAPPSAASQFSANDAVWLFIRKDADLTDQEKQDLQFIRQASATAETAYGLVQEFLTMVRKRKGENLDAWLEAVHNSQIPELHRFALGILRDKEPVVAGLTQIYSNGPVEAQVHKLKLVKRQMFGRAKLPLLKQRLLHAF